MNPFAAARALGVEVVTDSIPEAGRYYPDLELVVLREGLPSMTARSVLAHELGHHRHGDHCSTPRAELRAWRWGANLLLTPDIVAAAVRNDPGRPDEWCRALQVTPKLLRAWLGQPRNRDAAAALLEGNR